MIGTEAELRHAMDRRRPGGSDLLRVLPRDSMADVEGCIIVDGRGESWTVYRLDRGPKGRRVFDTEAEAYDHVHHWWVLRGSGGD